MSTYYEILGVEPTADAATISGVTDDLFEKWRRLVNHHDASVVDQANQSLRTIEAIRAALLDSRARAAYDAGIGIGGVGGLLDPDRLVQRASPPPSIAVAPSTSSAAGRPAQVSNPWTCPSCGVENLERAKFCVACATQLIRQCLACGQMTSLVATGICWECGSRYDEQYAQQKLAEAAEQARAEQLAAEQAAAERQRLDLERVAQETGRNPCPSCGYLNGRWRLSCKKCRAPLPRR